MGRPPHSPRPWAPPTGMVHSGVSKTNHNKTRSFYFDIPPVPPEVANVIKSRASSNTNPFAAQQNRIRALTNKLQDQQKKAKTAQAKITELELQKQESLQQIRESNQAEMSKNVQSVERKLRARHAKEAAVEKQAFEQELNRECEVRRKRFRDELVLQEEEDEQAQKATKTMEASETATAVEKLEQPSRSAALLAEAETELAQVETLKESRAEMIWLLKQVIKEEEKRKAKKAAPP